jgi:acetyl esterase/lipase
MLRTILPATATLALLLSCCAQSQTLKLWPGVAPGSENWTYKERTVEDTPLGTVVLNVTAPTLTAYLPERSRSTGTAIVVAPGGAFVALAIDREGTDMARWLQEKGIAAFVLKYRLMEKREEGIPSMDQDEASKYGIADGIQAVKVVREHAAEYGIDPRRVGFIGFSAGAMVSSGVLLNPDAAARPDFAALIYGAPFGKLPAIPQSLPPVFLAWAQDDPLVMPFLVRFHDALRTAGHKPEVHAFSAGGHGFGLLRQGTSSDHWNDNFYYWLEAQGFTRTATAARR